MAERGRSGSFTYPHPNSWLRSLSPGRNKSKSPSRINFPTPPSPSMKHSLLSPSDVPMPPPPRTTSKTNMSVKTTMYVQPPQPSTPAPIIPPTPPPQVLKEIERQKRQELDTALDVLTPPEPTDMEDVLPAEPGVPPPLLTPLNRRPSIANMEHRRTKSKSNEIVLPSPKDEKNLWQAVRSNHEDRVREILTEAKVNVNDPDWANGGVTALHWAGVNGYTSMVKLLLDSGANANIKAGEPSANALHWASRAGHLDCVKCMLEHPTHPANPAYLDSQGYNSLLLAVHGGHHLVAEYLVKTRGFNVNFPDPASRTPLIWTAYLGNSKEMVDVLLENGADVNASDVQGFTALHWAIGTRHIDTAKKLLFAGAWPFVRDKEGYTCEDRARMLGLSGAWTALLKIVELRRGYYGPAALQSTISSISTPALSFGSMVQAKIDGKTFTLPKSFSPNPKPVDYIPPRSFTLNGANVPGLALSLGLKTSQEDLELGVLTALKIGYRHFDTSPLYQNEAEFGKALKRAFDGELGFPLSRSDVFISSKLPNTMHKPSDVLVAIEKSLNKIGLDYFDVYFLEWPISFVKDEGDENIPLRDSNGCVVVDDDIDLGATWRAMESLLLAPAQDKQPLTKALGIANFSMEKLRWLLDYSDVKPSIHEYETHPHLPQADMLSFCRKNDILVFGYCPVKKLIDDDYLALVAKKYNVPPVTVLISRSLLRGVVCVFKSYSTQHLEENYKTIALEPSDLEVLGTIGKRTRWVNPVKIFGLDIFGEGGGEEGFEGQIIANTLGFDDI